LHDGTFGKSLLSRGGELHLPEAYRLGSAEDLGGGLFAELTKIGVHAHLNFICAVFHDQKSRLSHVFYRGDIIAPGSAAQIAEQPV
jgi:hypothetical protein